MKKIRILSRILLSIAFVYLSVVSSAQSPEKVSYQSVIRDASGELVRSQTVGIRISILHGTADGTAVYVETHTPETNVNGLATIEVGNGTPATGTFSSIDWGDGPYFLKVETDPEGGTSYSIAGTSEIMSVPYALHAKNVKGAVDADNNVVSNVADPVDYQDAATKVYVDLLNTRISRLENTIKSGGGIFDERDGNYYNTVKIGEQIWMAENLAYLPQINRPSEQSYTIPLYYVYEYEGTEVNEAKAIENYQIYGVLYNWQAAISACPSGWHLPSDDE
ncbi:MAG: hypothetical protein K9H26_08480 [Prolixibacteraceae bacterium]|nr:hypothetical protein [Prolixibacteraceae bacterium]